MNLKTLVFFFFFVTLEHREELVVVQELAVNGISSGNLPLLKSRALPGRFYQPSVCSVMMYESEI